MKRRQLFKKMAIMAGASTGVASCIHNDNSSSSEKSTNQFNYTSNLKDVQANPDHGNGVNQYWVTPQEFGAFGDGNNDDSIAIQKAIDALAAQNGGIVYLPTGNYFLTTTQSTDSPDGTKKAFITLKSGVSLIGTGKYNSTLQRDASLNPTAILWVNEGDGRDINGIGFDGNQTNNNFTTHGIFWERTIEALTIDNCFIVNTGSYGIGMNGDWDNNSGISRHISVKNCHLKNIGADGIDMKNFLNETKGNSFFNLWIEGWGGRHNLSIQAGLDIRGVANHATQIYCTSPGQSGTHAVRFRGSGPSTPGGEENTLSNFWIDVSNRAVAGVRVSQAKTVVDSGSIFCSGSTDGFDIDDVIAEHSVIRSSRGDK